MQPHSEMPRVGSGPAWDRMMAALAGLGQRQGAEVRYQRRRDDHDYALRLRNRVLAGDVTTEQWLANLYRPTARDERIVRVVDRWFARRAWLDALMQEAA